jgi:cysteine-rich repeat protein
MNEGPDADGESERGEVAEFESIGTKNAAIVVTLGTVGPEGPQGPPGEQGPPGAAAFVGSTCPTGWYLGGFDESGNLRCAPLVGCGNGVVEPGETCDPPGLPGGQPNECRSDCTFCGDGAVNGEAGAEGCDDGNNVAGDGCDGDCMEEGSCVETGAPCIVFVTSAKYDGDLGGVSGADAKCNERAAAGGLRGTYMAWVTGTSSASAPAARFARSTGPYVLVDGTVVAESWVDLTDGSLAHSINLTELSHLPPIPRCDVWTGTWVDGTKATPDSDCGDCNGFTYNLFPKCAVAGDYSSTGFGWTENGSDPYCSAEGHLYCFQQ